MANSPRITAAVANAMLDNGLGEVSAIADGGKLCIYTGTQPASGGGALSGNTLLATLTMGTPAFAAASAGILVANAITPESNAPATGTATWFRLYESDGTTPLLDGSVGTSSCDLNLSSTSIASGATVTATSLQITMPRS